MRDVPVGQVKPTQFGEQHVSVLHLVLVSGAEAAAKHKFLLWSDWLAAHVIFASYIYYEREETD